MNLQNATMGNFRGKSTHVNMEKLIEVIEMIGLLVVVAVLIFCIIILAMKLWDCSANLDRAEYRIDSRGAEINELKERCEGHKELIEALSKSVRELNGVVEAAVKSKEQTSDNKPDMSALIGGWTTDDGQARIDASHISAGMIDGKSLMNCELPSLSEPVREKIFEMFGAKLPEEEKPANATHISVGLIDGQSLVIPVREAGRILIPHEKTVANHWHGRLWTDDDGHIYELPEGCYILGDTPYEMD